MESPGGGEISIETTQNNVPSASPDMESQDSHRQARTVRMSHPGGLTGLGTGRYQLQSVYGENQICEAKVG